MATRTPSLSRDDQQGEVQNSSLKQPAMETARSNPEQVAIAADHQNDKIKKQVARRSSLPSEKIDTKSETNVSALKRHESQHIPVSHPALAASTMQNQTRGSGLTFSDNSTSYEHPLFTSKILEQSHPRSINSLNDNSHDDTVDADNKQGEASLPTGKRLNNVVSNNATLVNAVLTNPHGLAGFDSRSSGNHPVIEVNKNCEVKYLADISVEEKNNQLNLQNESLPANHIAVAHRIKIEPKAEDK